MPITVATVDDNPLVLTTMRRLLEGHPEVELVAEYCSCEDALEGLKEIRPDVFLVDLEFTDSPMQGEEFIRLAHDSAPEAGYVVLTGLDGDRVVDAVRAGGVAAVAKARKPFDTDAVLDAIEAVAAGGHYFSQAFLHQVVEALHEEGSPRLTEAELEVYRLTQEGKTRQEVAKARGVSAETVKAQLREIARKLRKGPRPPGGEPAK